MSIPKSSIPIHPRFLGFDSSKPLSLFCLSCIPESTIPFNGNRILAEKDCILPNTCLL